jgi:hypothetical protein
MLDAGARGMSCAGKRKEKLRTEKNDQNFVLLHFDTISRNFYSLPVSGNPRARGSSIGSRIDISTSPVLVK